jgi:hypothetical protein
LRTGIAPLIGHIMSFTSSIIYPNFQKTPTSKPK